MQKLEEKIKATEDQVKELADLVTRNYNIAVNSLKKKDKEKAQQVQEIWTDAFRMVFQIEEEALTALMLHQPFGKKFRKLAAALKIATDLERIGKYTIHVAEASEALSNAEREGPWNMVSEMISKTEEILNYSLKAFYEEDLGLIPSLSEIDDEIDALYDETFEAFGTEYNKGENPVQHYGHIVLLIRSLERLADHACNIGSRVLFMIEGKRYRIY